MENKYLNISSQKEMEDTLSLVDKISKDGWLNSNTILVNCFPEYSSRLTQTVNHLLSSLNKNQLFEQIDLQMPYPNTSQVWNVISGNYDNYDTYLKNWINTNVYSNNYLFVGSTTLVPRSFNKLKLSMRNKVENENFRFATLYCEKGSILIPDYYVDSFDKQEGDVLFDWQNPKNPNWK